MGLQDSQQVLGVRVLSPKYRVYYLDRHQEEILTFVNLGECVDQSYSMK